MPRSRKPALLLLLLAITSTHAFLLPHLHTSSCLRLHHSKQPTRRLSLRSISTPPLHGSSSADEEADVATLQANEGWVEPWAGTESSDLVRIVFDCYEKDKMVIDPWLLSELLLETGAYSSQIEDAAKDTKDETPIFGEHGEPACSEKIWNRSLVMADYGLEVDVGGVLVRSFQKRGRGRATWLHFWSLLACLIAVSHVCTCSRILFYLFSPAPTFERFSSSLLVLHHTKLGPSQSGL